jgi:hypothetical protein
VESLFPLPFIISFLSVRRSCGEHASRGGACRGVRPMTSMELMVPGECASGEVAVETWAKGQAATAICSGRFRLPCPPPPWSSTSSS